MPQIKVCIAKLQPATDRDEGRDDGELAGRQTVRQMQPENMGKEDLLTVFVPCGRVQPDMDLFEL